MKHPDRIDVERHRRVGLAVTLVAVCGLVAAVLVLPNGEYNKRARLVISKPATQAKPLPRVPRALDEKFVAFSAPSASLTENFKAYGWIKECLWERNFAARGVPHSSQCALSDQYVDDLELRKQLVTRLALAGSFAAITDVHTEGPDGLFKAFADDPEGHAALMEEADRVGLEMGEPAALAAAAVRLRAEGSALRLVGAAQSARSKHLKALGYEVASLAGLAKQTGEVFAGRDDPKVQDAVREYEDRLGPEDRGAAVSEGERIADGWHPLCPVACQISR